MKLFVSWSGDGGQQIAQKVREWLPLILPAVKPFITTTDIDKGAHWQGEIRRELEQSNYGIVCLTPEGLDSKWLAFEAGALSKHLTGRVATVLFGLTRPVVPPPFDMFQSTLFNETEVRQLVANIDGAVDEGERRGDAQLDAVFPKLWPMLEEPIKLILQQLPPEDARVTTPDLTVIGQEMMAMLRQINGVLSNPEKLLAPMLEKLDVTGPAAIRDIGRASRAWARSNTLVDDAVLRAALENVNVAEVLRRQWEPPATPAPGSTGTTQNTKSRPGDPDERAAP